MVRVLLSTLMLLMSQSVIAHASSNAYLYWSHGEAQARVDIAVVDAQRLVTMDKQANGELTWSDVLAQKLALEKHLRANITAMNSDQTCPVVFALEGVSQYGDGPYLSILLNFECSRVDQLQYALFADIDTEHRLLARIREGDADYLRVIDPSEGLVLPVQPPSTWSVFGQFVYQGVLHLWLGYDHMLFLLTLLLALVCTRSTESRLSDSARSLTLRALTVVSAFTVAHSITLVVATLGWVSVPSRWVETLIAASISLAALNVWWPMFPRRTYLLAFIFGLIHGFGFSSVLSDLISAGGQRAVALAGFNIGVEIGQAVLVLLILPLLALAMRRKIFQNLAVPAVVLAITATGMVWTFQRAL